MYRVIFTIMLSFSIVIFGMAPVMASPDKEKSAYTAPDYMEYLTDMGKTDPEALKMGTIF